ncbi:O-antigen ligase family protein [Ancylobacter vacuolatus]|uniref:O-antigen ligase n=1 Tax=Ancylobacter vacuolatus TaxID=223389 RepID=A0ABU0DNT5_9HYPH|nr:O-antigen ligase family protein [Ancylobacter vacuolatus]MDQ0350004.1 O-antigen ligase [Ancylobacter vacuolatus]
MRPTAAARSAPRSAKPGAPRASAFLARGTRAETYNDLVFAGLVLGLAWVPFLLGSNRLVAWGVNAVLFGMLLALFEAGRLVSGARHPIAPRRLWWGFLMLSAVAGWIVFQLSSWAPPAWQNPFWSLSADVLQALPGAGPIEGRVSVTPDAGVRGLVLLLTNAMAFYLALQLCRDGRRADLLLRALVVIGVGYALFGLVQHALAPHTLLWFERQAYIGQVTSTFVNKNSYATYAGIGLIATIGLLIDVYRRAGRRRDLPLAVRATAFVETTLQSALPILASAGVIGVALVLTVSRAGFIAGIAGLLTLILLALTASRRRWLIFVIAAPVLAVLLAALALFGDDLGERFTLPGAGDARWEVAARALEAVRDAPLTGFGYGSFERMFAVYRGSEAFTPWHHWDKAHNTYIELLFDLGIPATALLVVLVGALLAVMLANMLRREAPHMISLVALAASATVLLHAAFDFSLQIQAVAITYWAVVGAGLAQSWSRRIDTAA